MSQRFLAENPLVPPRKSFLQVFSLGLSTTEIAPAHSVCFSKFHVLYPSIEIKSRFTARAAEIRADWMRLLSSVTNSTYSRLNGNLGFHRCSRNSATAYCQFCTGLSKNAGQPVAEMPPDRVSWIELRASSTGVPFPSPVLCPSSVHAAVTRWIRSPTTLGTAPINGSVPQVLADPSRAA